MSILSTSQTNNLIFDKIEIHTVIILLRILSLVKLFIKKVNNQLRMIGPSKYDIFGTVIFDSIPGIAVPPYYMPLKFKGLFFANIADLP